MLGRVADCLAAKFGLHVQQRQRDTGPGR